MRVSHARCVRVGKSVEGYLLFITDDLPSDKDYG